MASVFSYSRLFQALIYSILTLSYSNASGLPLSGLPCRKKGFENGYEKGFRDLVEKVSIIGDDDRVPLTDEYGQKLGLSPVEVKRLRQVTGFVYCGKQGPLSIAPFSATLLSDGTILTAAHGFYDEVAKKYREPLSSCYFQNQEDPTPKKVLLDIGPDHSGLKIPSGYPENANQDYAIAKLATPFPLEKGVRPLKVDLSNVPLEEGSPMWLISAFQIHNNSKFKDGSIPVIQKCTAQKIKMTSPSVIFGDCDTLDGASGGAHIVRNSLGELVLKGVLVGDGKGAVNDGLPYKNGKKKPIEQFSYEKRIYSYGAGVDGQMLSDILEFDPTVAQESDL